MEILGKEGWQSLAYCIGLENRRSKEPGVRIPPLPLNKERTMKVYVVMRHFKQSTYQEPGDQIDGIFQDKKDALAYMKQLHEAKEKEKGTDWYPCWWDVETHEVE